MVFHLRWDGSLVSDKQTVKNFVVFYQSTAAAPIQVFDTLCNETASNTPCLKNINPLPTAGSRPTWSRQTTVACASLYPDRAGA